MVEEFRSKWRNFSPKRATTEVSIVSKAPFGTFDTIIPGRLADNSCICNPLPSRDVGPLSSAGVGPDIERCGTCGKTWRCRICDGCRYCRSPG